MLTFKAWAKDGHGMNIDRTFVAIDEQGKEVLCKGDRACQVRLNDKYEVSVHELRPGDRLELTNATPLKDLPTLIFSLNAFRG